MEKEISCSLEKMQDEFDVWVRKVKGWSTVTKSGLYDMGFVLA